MSALPVMLRGEAVEALVVGGGAVPPRKVRDLCAAGARVHVVALAVGDELRALADAEPAVRVSERAFADGDVDDATLVIAATDVRAVNAAVARAAHARRRLVNVADAPEEGTFAGAATHRAGELVIAVSAGGVPTAAARVRDALAERFDARYGEAVAELAGLRRALLASGRREAWRAAAAALTGPGFTGAVESGRFAEQVRRWE